MSIHQEITLPCAPERVFAALTDGEQFTAATGNRQAVIGAGEGAAFSLFAGAIHGRHIELVANERIVQAWRVQPWQSGVYSVVRFKLTGDANHTKVVLDHDGYPPEMHDHLTSGWHANYWEPLAQYLG